MCFPFPSLKIGQKNEKHVAHPAGLLLQVGPNLRIQKGRIRNASTKQTIHKK